MATGTVSEEKDGGLDVRLLLTTLIAFRRGDFSTRMPNDWTGLHGKIADMLNEIIDMAERTTGDFERVSQVVGKAGKVNVRLSVADLHGSWAKLVDSSNTVIDVNTTIKCKTRHAAFGCNVSVTSRIPPAVSLLHHY